MIRRQFGCFSIVLLLMLSTACSSMRTKQHDADTTSWEITGHGVQLSLTQIQPDHVRGFYLARGFDAAAADAIAGHCVFQTVMRNVSAPGAIHFKLSDWRVLATDGEYRLKLASDWRKEWDQRKVSQSARLSFRWAQLPPQQSYELGDWNMGMTMVALPLGSRFDLRITWKTGTDKHEATLLGVHCAMETNNDDQN